MTIVQTLKPVRKSIKKFASKERLYKALIIVSSVALLAASILPYLIT